MDIDFFNLRGDDGWVEVVVDAADPRQRWVDGRALHDAPIDVEATFAGAMWRSTKVDPTFNLFGLRCRPGFTVPLHHLDMRELIIVFGGELEIEYVDGDQVEQRRVEAGEFWVSDPGTPFMMTAGADGVTYFGNWPEAVAGLTTTWHDRGWSHRRDGTDDCGRNQG